MEEITSANEYKFEKKQAKTRRGKKFLESREPKRFEDEKKVMLVRGANASGQITQLLKDLCILKKPQSIFFGRKNDFRPFEDQSSIEFLARKNDCPLFAFASHTKKRPSNLVLGRLFNYQLLDMAEFGVDNYRPLSDFPTSKISLNVRPLILTSGRAFIEQESYRRLHNLFVDLFSARTQTKLNLGAVEHVIHLTAFEEKIMFRSYRVIMTASGVQTPRVELEEMGPHFDLSIRRQRLASKELFRKACYQQFSRRPKKIKNVEKTALGHELGRVHMDRQDYDKLAIRKFKGLKADGKRPFEDDDDDDDQQQNNEDASDKDVDDDDVDDVNNAQQNEFEKQKRQFHEKFSNSSSNSKKFGKQHKKVKFDKRNAAFSG